MLFLTTVYEYFRYKHLPALGKKMKHTTLLEEFIFWTFKYEFPQNVVCFLLNMLPDQDYKVINYLLLLSMFYKLILSIFCYILGTSNTHICNALCSNTFGLRIVSRS